ncbi:MAG: LysM peptidoglycan-binding domain-containing protein [Verrucomicrobiota bacterium]
MLCPFLRPVSLAAILGLAGGSLFAQTVVKPPVAPSKIEPGLELAVNWKWWVAPSPKPDWGMPQPEALLPKLPDPAAPRSATPAALRPETYEVKKGDAIVKIARKFGMTAAQLKQFNALKDDLIHIGEVLRIPTPEQVLAMTPPPPEPKKEVVGKKTTATPAGPLDYDPGSGARLELENVLLQVFLDREMFAPGAIDGKSGATYLKIRQVYQNTHDDAADPGLLKAKAEATLKQPYTHYSLRAEDFKFIKSPKAEAVAGRNRGEGSSAKKKSAKAGPPAVPPATLDELVAADFLGYTSVWEFVAERFHCDEEFLHQINQQLKGPCVVGAEFVVPNVIPFEIEKALEPPLQPATDPQKLVAAAVVDSSRLEISCAGRLIAVMPLASARPGLHGHGSWTVLDAIPQPRLATKREAREIPKEKPAPAGVAIPGANPVSEPPLEKEQYLAPGPNNPVGILWLNLAKSGSKEPLPYGLHGTSIPARMGTLQGIGGLRLANWDIARAARLMPAGTALQWKSSNNSKR